ALVKCGHVLTVWGDGGENWCELQTSPTAHDYLTVFEELGVRPELTHTLSDGDLARWNTVFTFADFASQARCLPKKSKTPGWQLDYANSVAEYEKMCEGS